MPAHDWARVDAGIFHAFHLAWLGYLQTALNDGLLPAGYYALAEQHAGAAIPDFLTLHASPAGTALPRHPRGAGVATVTKTQPRVQRKLAARAAPRARRRTLAVRHVSGHQIVSLFEIVSIANKDRRRSVTEFVNKVVAAIQFGIHVTLVDLFPPGPQDPGGMHGAVWDRFDPDHPYTLPPDQPLTLAAYAAHKPARVYINHLAVGDPLPEMPLFLAEDAFIRLPLERTYADAYGGMPAFWREVLEGRRPAP